MELPDGVHLLSPAVIEPIKTYHTSNEISIYQLSGGMKNNMIVCQKDINQESNKIHFSTFF